MGGRVALIERHCAALGRDPATLRRSYHPGFPRWVESLMA